VSGDLVNDEIRIHEVSNHAPSGTCGSHSQDLHPVPSLLPEVPEECLGDLDGLSLGGNIAFLDNLPPVVDERVLGGGGPHINAQIASWTAAKTSP